MIGYFTLPSGFVCYLWRLRYGVPYAISLQGGDVPGLVPELNRFHARLRWLRHRVLASARTVVANSQGLAALSMATDPFPVEVVPNGVDATLFHPAPEGNGSELPFRILFVGRLERQKNLELLLERLANLRRRRGAVFRLHVAGDGPLSSAMRRRAESLMIGDRVVWHGWVPKAELVALYQQADCFVTPSLFEGLPNTVTEAMASGLPVIASKVIGNVELVENDKTGFLFDLEEPWELERALLHLMENPQVGRRMGDEGRARVLAKFSWETAASSYCQIFASAGEHGENCPQRCGQPFAG